MTEVNAASRWNAGHYAEHAAFVPALGAPVMALLDPKPGERILDLGCGDGVLTERIASAGADVLGVDYAEAMLAPARARGLTVEQRDGQALDFGPEYDAVFSNAALHWMLDAASVARGVFAALKPGGRFVGEMGGEGNVLTLRTSLRAAVEAMGYAPPERDPQWYPSPEEFARVYREAGFVDIDARLIPRPTPLPSGVATWFRTFRVGFLDVSGVPEDARDALAEAAAARAEPRLARDADGAVLADYVRLRFTMRKPA